MVQRARENAEREPFNVIHAEEILEHFNHHYDSSKNKCHLANLKMLRHFEVMWDCHGSTQEIFTADREGRLLRHPHSEPISTFLLFFEKLERVTQYANGNHNKKTPCKF